MNSVLDWHRKNNPYLYDTTKWFVFLVILSELDILTTLEGEKTYFNIADKLEPK